MSTGEEDISVNQVCEQCDLGVLFSNLELTYTILCKKLILRLIGFIEVLDVPMLRALHTGLVCSLYARVIWCPLQLGDMRDIEKV